MRINDAYEHEPLRCPESAEMDSSGSCRKQGEQCVDVSVPLTVTPDSHIGPVCTVCRGEPSTVCVTDPNGTSCTVTFTQKLCISVPICYSVNVSEGSPRIACASETGHCGCRSCGENG